MVNAVQNAHQVKFTAIWLAALARLRLKLVRPLMWRSILGVTVALFGLTYVWQANSSAAANVQIRQLRLQAAELNSAHAQLETRIIQLQSLSRVAEASQRLGLTALPNQQFANIAVNRVAAR